MMKLLRCVLLVGVSVFTPRMCRALSLYNAMAEIKELVTCIFSRKSRRMRATICGQSRGAKGKGV